MRFRLASRRWAEDADGCSNLPCRTAWPISIESCRGSLVLAAVTGGALLAGPQAHAADGQIDFGPPQAYPGSAYSDRSVLGAGLADSGDVDGDGDADVVVNNCAGTGPTVLPNVGGGRLGAASNPPAASDDACAVAVGDLNADGRADIVTGSPETNRITLLLSTGGQAFSHAGRHAVGGQPSQFALADFNSDGHTDVAVLTLSGTVQLFWGNGSGGLSDGGSVAVASQSISFAAADFDGDGDPDLAVSDVFATVDPLNTSAVVVLRNDGSGGFATAGSYPVGQSPEDMVAADLDGDDHLDLVVANANTNDLSLLYGRGDGGFEAERRLGTTPVRLWFGAPPSLSHPPIDGRAGVRVADFDHDGVPDIASTQALANTVEVFPGRGSRSFGSVVAVPTSSDGAYTPSGHGQAVLAVDLNGDTFADLVSPGYLPPAGTETTEVAVLLNTSDEP